MTVFVLMLPYSFLLAAAQSISADSVD